MRYLTIVLLLYSVVAGFADVQSNSINLITSNTMKTNSFSVNFLNAYSSTPTVVMGLFRWFEQAQLVIDYSSSIGTIGTTSFQVSYTVGSSCTIEQQYYYWMSFNNTLAGAIYAQPNLNYMGRYDNVALGSGVRCTGVQVAWASETANQTNPYPNPLTNPSPVKTYTASAASTEYNLQILVFLQGFKLTTSSSGSTFNITSKIYLINSTTYSLSVCTSTTNVLEYFRYGRLIFNETSVEAGSVTCIDWGVNQASGTWSQLSFNVSNPGSYNHSTMAIGLSSMTILNNIAMDIQYNIATMPASGSGGSFTFLEFNWMYYYNTSCLACAASCLTCSVVATNCTSCSANWQRTKVGQTCPCNTGYVDTGAKACQACSQTLTGCTACSSTTTCTTCNSSLYLTVSGGQCVCQSGNFRTMSSGVCQCGSGYYDNGVAVCASCSQGCTACSSASSCTACNSSQNYVVSSGSCVCATGYVSGPSGCGTCSSFISGCTACTSSTACTTCNSSLYLTVASGGSSCICQSGYVMNSGVCQLCNVTLTACTACSSTSVCTDCNTSAGYQLNSGQCQCQSGYYGQSGSCQSCSSAMVGCQLCSSSTHCTQCDTNFSINSSNGCTCNNGYYLSSSTCVLCEQSISGCSQCSSATTCTQCTTGLTVSSGRCQCAQTNQYYNSTLAQCTDCPATCATCNNATACLTCDTSANKVLNSSNQCVCRPNYVDDGSGVCQSTGACQSGYDNTSSGCVEICGDGKLYELECDDGNLANGDGCSSTCTVETNFTCRDGNSTSSSKCSYNQPFELQLVSSLKDIFANAIDFTLSVKPDLTVLQQFNFNQIVSSDLPTQSISASYSTGQVLIKIIYGVSIQNVSASIQLTPPTNLNNSFALKASSTSFTVDPQNAEAYYYPTEIYDSVGIIYYLFMGVLGLGMLTLLLGLCSWQLIGLEATSVLQILAIESAMFSVIPPIWAPIAWNSQYAFGYNTLFHDITQWVTFSSANISKNLVQMQFHPNFAQNYNYMLALQLLLAILGILIYVLSLIVDTSTNSIRNSAKYLMNQLLFCVAIFSSLLIGFNIGIHVQYMSQLSLQSQSTLIVNYGIMGMSLFLCIFYFGLVIGKPEYYERTLSVLKSDKPSKAHAPIMLIFRLVTGILIGGMCNTNYAAIAASLIQICYLLYVGIRKPYKKKFINIRAIINELSILIVLASASIYVYYVNSQNLSESNIVSICKYHAYAVLILTALTLLIDLGGVCYGIFKICSKKKTATIHPKQISDEDSEIMPRDSKMEIHPDMLQDDTNGSSEAMDKMRREYDKSERVKIRKTRDNRANVLDMTPKMEEWRMPNRRVN